MIIHTNAIKIEPVKLPNREPLLPDSLSSVFWERKNKTFREIDPENPNRNMCIIRSITYRRRGSLLEEEQLLGP